MKFSKEPENRNFPKGLVYGFCPNIEVFLIGVFHRSYFRKDRIFKLWKEKNDFNRKKNEILKRAKKWTFSKRVSLCPKIELFLVGVFHRNYIRKDRF